MTPRALDEAAQILTAGPTSCSLWGMIWLARTMRELVHKAGLGNLILALFAVLLWLSSPVAGAAELHDAVKANDLQHVQALISSGANVNELDLYGTPLHIAAARDSVEIAKVLIDAGADLEAEAGGSQNKGHPLHTAAAADQVAVAALLIERGAKVDARDSKGRTPLIVAASYGHAQLAELLLESGADPLEEDTIYRQTPIHAASVAGKVEVVMLVLSAGVNINLRNNHSGETPLMYALREENIDLVDFLLANGADPNVADENGQTPIKRAYNPQTRDLLRQFGAR
jgi:ankyrin repeat protein